MPLPAQKVGAILRSNAIICLFGWLTVSVAYSQSSATVQMDHGEVTAGDTVSMVLSFDKPATCSQEVIIEVLHSDPKGNKALDFRGQLETGTNTATITTVIPKDYQGEFHSLPSATYLFPCQGYSATKPFTTRPVTLNVRGIPDPNSYPANADAALSLTQKQFLNTKIAELNDLSSQIDTRVEENGNDSVELRVFLAGIVEKAEADLQVTERQYRTQLLKSTDSLPTFFADFRRQYAHLHDELKAPIPGTRAGVEQSGGHLLYVQQPLKRRSPSDTQTKGRNLSGTSPAIARATKETVNDNASAYAIVNATGRALFHAQFTSLPTGATIYYRQAILPDFNTWSSKTDSPGGDFDLATFVFKFHKDECEDEPVVTIDPYNDTHPNVSVEFKRCGKK